MRTKIVSLTRKDFIVETLASGGGPGGQNRNKVETCVRITHPESGARGESRGERSQYANRKIAFERLAKAPSFMAWVRGKVREIEQEESILEWAKSQMSEDKLKFEVHDDKGRWVEWHP